MGSKMTRRIAGVFAMIEAEPNTGWLYGTPRLDGNGFIVRHPLRTPLKWDRYGT
jgi:hypothetical protein